MHFLGLGGKGALTQQAWLSELGGRMCHEKGGSRKTDLLKAAHQEIQQEFVSQ